MIRYASDLEEAAALAPDDPAHVLVKAFADVVGDQRTAFLGAEDEMVEEVREGVCHRELFESAYQIPGFSVAGLRVLWPLPSPPRGALGILGGVTRGRRACGALTPGYMPRPLRGHSAGCSADLSALKPLYSHLAKRTVPRRGAGM